MFARVYRGCCQTPQMYSAARRRVPAFGLPGHFYRDAGIYDLELDLVFSTAMPKSGHLSTVVGIGARGSVPLVKLTESFGCIKAEVSKAHSLHAGHRSAREKSSCETLYGYGQVATGIVLDEPRRHSRNACVYQHDKNNQH
jgi:hypothetical protein